MKKTRILARIAGGAAAAALVLAGTAVPAQARDTGWNPTSSKDRLVQTTRDTGWNPV